MNEMTPPEDGAEGSAARPDPATAAQIAAADPSGSVWLAANAGAGKTRVLTDRVAWLLLEGTSPDRILCLTFTKAAAGEMQNRLFRRLGEWAVMPDPDLRAKLRHLGVAPGRIDARALRRARTLFAGAVETPGGLKIQTIHAFCASLLRRFPLEAGVSPGFQEMDDLAGRRLMTDVLDLMAEDEAEAPCVRALCAQLTDAAADTFLSTVAAAREGLEAGADEAALRAALGVAAGDDRAAIRANAVNAAALDVVEATRDAARAAPGKTMDALAETLERAMLADDATRFDLCCGAFLTDKGEPRKRGLTKDAAAAYAGGDAAEDWATLCGVLVAAQDRLRGLDALDRARVLHDFAPRFLARVAEEKAARGWLDFADLILRARALLSSRDTAQWVLWKLDGGIDHILVDEAQDTAPAQWDVIEPLLREFGAGAGARGGDAPGRTLFVVGDRKQSIYSFQGADPDVFDAKRAAFGALLKGGVPLRDHALRHSFRSAPVLLRLVDRVFDAPSGAGGPTTHIAFRDALPGRVDLWPHVPKPCDPEPRDWTDPRDIPAADDAVIVLARHIARSLRDMIDARTLIEVRDGARTVRRPVEPRDVLILVRSREDKLFGAIIAACKAAGLDLAGADRLRLAEDLAVRDLLALCRVAATPEDDLSLATVLRSPLGGLSEADLFAVAHGRRGTLRRALTDHGGFPDVAAMLGDVLARGDFLRPYELLQRILVAHDGRRRLIGRLGPEVEEAIDGLLHQALAYEQYEIPSLTGFLGWIEEADIEIKRQAAGGAIRIMTIHGAKGLEAPVVVLPHCGPWRDRPAPPLLPVADGPVLWTLPKAACNAALRDAADAWQARQADERDRLLYVALTRAESWLILASAGADPAAAPTSWGARLRVAMEAEGAAPHDFEGGAGLRLEAGDWITPGDVSAPAAVVEPPTDPWEEAPPQPPAAAPEPAAPSDLGGAKTLPGEDRDVIEREAAIRHGLRVHALLEHLPALPRDAWEDAAGPILDRHAETQFGDDWEASVDEAVATLDAFPNVFAPDTLAEVPFSLPAVGDRPALSGTMDRLIVAPDRVTVVDYKTNRAVPDAPDAVPEGILRQMGAYHAACAAIWPRRRVETAVLWTAARRLMPLPDDVVRRAWLRADAP